MLNKGGFMTSKKWITNCVKIFWLHFWNDNVIRENYCIKHSLMVLLCCLDNPSVLCLSVLASVFPKVRELDKEGEQSCQQLNFYHSGLLYARTDARKTRLYFWVTPLRWGWLMRHCQKAQTQWRHCDFFSSLCGKVVMPVASYQWSLLARAVHHIQLGRNWTAHVKRRTSVEVKDVILRVNVILHNDRQVYLWRRVRFT